MKNLFVACFIMLAFSFSVFAKLAVVHLDEAIKDSDLIIVGTLRKISEKSEEGTIYGKGEIFVEQFVAGNVEITKGFVLQPGAKLDLNYVEGSACVYGSHKRIENEKVVFLLTFGNGEIQLADFRSLSDLPEIRKLLRKGIKPSGVAKSIKTQNEFEKKPQTLMIDASIIQPSQESFNQVSTNKSEEKKYQPFRGFLVALASLFLYYFLYRSRFKIR